MFRRTSALKMSLIFPLWLNACENQPFFFGVYCAALLSRFGDCTPSVEVAACGTRASHMHCH